MTAWTEDHGRAVVWARSGRRCEICKDAEATDWSHRVDRSDGGTWAPSNGIAACRPDHQWLHEHPRLAWEGGWRLRSGADPLLERVWLWTPYGQDWWLLTDAGEYALWAPGPPVALPPGVVLR